METPDQPAASAASLNLRRAFRRNLFYAFALAVMAGFSGSFILALASLHDLFDALLHRLNLLGVHWSRSGEKSARNCVIVPLMPLFTSALLALSVVPVGILAGLRLASHQSSRPHYIGLSLAVACGDLLINLSVERLLRGVEQEHAHSSWLHQIGDIVAGLLAIVAFAVILAGADGHIDPLMTLVGAPVIIALCIYNSLESWASFQSHQGDHDHEHSH